MSHSCNAGRVRRIILVLGAFGFLLGAAAAGAAAAYKIGAAPSWVRPVEPGVINEALLDQASDGVYYLLSDTQMQLGGKQRSRYRRIVAKALSTKGVESLANLEFSFEPEYEELILNSVSVVRDGVDIPKLKDAQIRVLQRETELDRLIFDGSVSANIFLEDVRAGDLVDYAYTVVGRNPVFGGIDSGGASLEYSVPLARVHLRLEHPVGKALDWTTVPRTVEPAVRTAGGRQELEWDLRDVPALRVDRDSPGWYDPYLSAFWTQFSSWSEVVDWALPLYAMPAHPGAELQSAIDEIATHHEDPQARTLAALRYVQSEVRYLAVSIGTGSHAPNPPDVVLKRRFGDCKDKTLLLLTMLRALGVDANPALVNTGLRRGLATRLPSTGSFDHVLVQARVGDSTYWLDPTRWTQMGGLSDLHQPNYDLALPIAAGVTGLVPMGDPASRASEREVHVEIDARSGFDQSVGFTVTTKSSGAKAEDARADFAESSREDLQESYLKFYSDYFPKISVARPLEISDDVDSNRIVATEHYQIGDLADWSEDRQRFIAPIKVPDLNGYLNSDASPLRNAPLGLKYPERMRLTTEVLLPRVFSIKPRVERVDDPAFSLVRTIKPEGKVLTIVDEWTSKTDEISAKDTPRYLESLRKARALVGYQLSWAESGASGGAKSGGFLRRMLIFLCFFLVFYSFLAAQINLYDPAPPELVRAPVWEGIGGWLWLPAISVALLPIVLGYQLYDSFDVLGPEVWEIVKRPGSVENGWLITASFLVTMLGFPALLLASLLTAWQFFTKRSSLPAVFIGFTSLLLLFQVIEVLIGQSLGVGDALSAEDLARGVADLFRQALSTVIWIAYFLRSERVKATFRNRRVSEAAAATPAPAPAPARRAAWS